MDRVQWPRPVRWWRWWLAQRSSIILLPALVPFFSWVFAIPLARVIQTPCANLAPIHDLQRADIRVGGLSKGRWAAMLPTLRSDWSLFVPADSMRRRVALTMECEEHLRHGVVLPWAGTGYVLLKDQQSPTPGRSMAFWLALRRTTGGAVWQDESSGVKRSQQQSFPREPHALELGLHNPNKLDDKATSLLFDIQSQFHPRNCWNCAPPCAERALLQAPLRAAPRTVSAHMHSRRCWRP